MPTNWNPLVLAFAAGIPSVVAAILALVGVLISKANGRKSDEIHVLVNSNLTDVKTQLAASKAETTALRVLVGQLAARFDPAIVPHPDPPVQGAHNG